MIFMRRIPIRVTTMVWVAAAVMFVAMLFVQWVNYAMASRTEQAYQTGFAEADETLAERGGHSPEDVRKSRIRLEKRLATIKEK